MSPSSPSAGTRGESKAATLVRDRRTSRRYLGAGLPARRGFRMRRRTSLLFLGLFFAAALPALAQDLECPGCTLEIFDDEAMTRTGGVLTGPSKELWLGLRVPPGVTPTLTGLEFGIAGLDSFLVAVEPVDSTLAIIGSPWIPSGLD